MAARPASSLRGLLRGIDGKDYGAYQSLKGSFTYPDFRLIIAQIPKDPYAPPHTGLYRIQVDVDYLGDAAAELEDGSPIAGRAFRDLLARRFATAAAEVAGTRRGTGWSGIITLDEPGQCILERSAVVSTTDGFEVRCFVGLPGRGRRIDGALAEEMLLEELPAIVQRALASPDPSEVRRHIQVAEDSQVLRSMLGDRGLVAFVADGSILPRESGASDAPMSTSTARPFESPESLRVEVDLPHAGAVTGMGVPRGVTLIVGGGYHGKSTLLQALERGVYDHVPGDGREFCVTDPSAFKIRAYSGRNVAAADISAFIGDLPFGTLTTNFSTPNGSGSTSQAAAIVEALEIGATALLMDEDTCATNFMVRDRLMRELVAAEGEPIVPYIDRVRWLWEERGVSSILVLGGVGDYFAVADTVIRMTDYEPSDVTTEARRIAKTAGPRRERTAPPDRKGIRMLDPSSIDPTNDYGKRSVYATDPRRIHFGKTDIDLTDLEQLDELSQTKAIAEALQWLGRTFGEPLRLEDAVAAVTDEVGKRGLDGISDRLSGNLAAFRGLELAGAINRLRTARITRTKE